MSTHQIRELMFKDCDMRHVCWHVCSSIHDIKIYNDWQAYYRNHFMHIHALVAGFY